MKKVAVAALLIAVSLQAQNAQAPRQETAPPARESAPQEKAPPSERTVVREFPLDAEAVKKLVDSGYDFSGVVRGIAPGSTTPSRCAIPLTPIPVPDKGNFSVNNSPANPLIDPKIVNAPLVPACAPTAAPQVIIPLQLEDGKKADKK